MMISLSLADNLEDFSGRVPLFPLPNVVHFPNLLLPLHIFEPRYRQMVEDALEGERLIALALLKPGWEATVDTKFAPIHTTVCVGRIANEQRLPDGRFMLLLQGLSRAELVAEEITNLPYRIGRLRLLEDRYLVPAVIDREHRRVELLAAFRDLFPQLDVGHIFMEAAESNAPLGVICDVLACAMQLDPAATQKFLDELDVDARSDRLLRMLRESRKSKRRTTGSDDFPPPFSEN